MKILFVCKGNICRSPMAEGIMKTLSADAGLNLHIDSAATHDYNIGSPPDSRAYLTCKTYSIDISQQKARLFEKKDFEIFDSIFVMDNSNLTNLFNIAETEEQKRKIIQLKNFIFSKKIENIPDPYNDDDEYFIEIYHLIYEACTNILKDLSYEMGKTFMQ